MTMTPHDWTQHSPAVREAVTFFETIAPQRLERIRQVFAPDARFKDPFNDVRGHDAIVRIFAHMFEQVHDPRFVILNLVSQGQQTFVTWDFHFRFKRFDTLKVQCIHGATHWVFDEQGRLSLHFDYWDAAEQLYEKLPVLGGLMRWLKRQA